MKSIKLLILNYEEVSKLNDILLFEKKNIDASMVNISVSDYLHNKTWRYLKTATKNRKLYLRTHKEKIEVVYSILKEVSEHPNAPSFAKSFEHEVKEVLN